MIDRRSFVAGAGAGILASGLPKAARAATSASRAFRIVRDGEAVGGHTLSATRDGSRIVVDIAIEIVIRVLGIAAYRYELVNREVWDGGRILSVDSRVNDDGDDHFSRVRRNGDTLGIEGSEFTGTAPLDAATTSYFVPEFLDRRPWISTQTGIPLRITAANAGAATAPGGVAATRWRIVGDFETDLLYDAGGEWVGCEFDAGDERAHYEIVGGSGRFTDLWSAA